MKHKRDKEEKEQAEKKEARQLQKIQRQMSNELHRRGVEARKAEQGRKAHLKKIAIGDIGSAHLTIPIPDPETEAQLAQLRPMEGFNMHPERDHEAALAREQAGNGDDDISNDIDIFLSQASYVRVDIPDPRGFNADNSESDCESEVSEDIDDEHL
jgi:hypothetical protein